MLKTQTYLAALPGDLTWEGLTFVNQAAKVPRSDNF